MLPKTMFIHSRRDFPVTKFEGHFITVTKDNIVEINTVINRDGAEYTQLTGVIALAPGESVRQELI